MVFSNLSNPSQMQITLDLVLVLGLDLDLAPDLVLDLVVPTLLDNTALNQASLLFVPVLLCLHPHLVEVMAQLTPHHLFVSMR